MTQPVPPSDPARAETGLIPGAAPGWRPVVEGSNPGAALRLQATQPIGFGAAHGARHLPQVPEGRAAQGAAPARGPALAEARAGAACARTQRDMG